MSVCERERARERKRKGGRGFGAEIVAALESPFYLSECIHHLVLESQLPHKTVNSIFESEIVNCKLAILRGS